MTHESVITLLEDTAKSMGDSVRFGYGDLADFNSISNKEFPYIWLYPLKGEFTTIGNGVSSIVDFDCELNFLFADSVTGADFETAEAWDKGFQLMEQYIHKLDEFILAYDPKIPSSDDIEISTPRFESGRKATGDALTGWKLTFTLKVPTQFEYCSLYDS